MPFPESHRVKFNKNPLRQVICQLRFPPILKIDTGIPADFQDKIRNSFPKFSQATELKIEFPKMMPGSLPPEVFDAYSQPTTNKNYSFLSEDEIQKVNLTRTFISFSTFQYNVWEEFRSIYSGIVDAFSDVYRPSYYSRVGLRYIDIFRRSELDLINDEWKSLLKSQILGIISDPDIGRNVEDYEGKYTIKLEDNQSIVRIVTKLINDESTAEQSFVIDSDFFYINKTEPDNVFMMLDYFNKRASRLINWAILPKLYDAMDPDEI